jgi:tartrate dehydratase alpha subunit/fumarate hydratase class I-like protein
MRAVRDLAVSVNRNLPGDVLEAFRRAREAEESPVGRSVLDKLIDIPTDIAPTFPVAEQLK